LVSNEFGQVLTVVYFTITSLLLVLSAGGNRAGYIGNIGLGLFLLVADMLKHGSEGLFRPMAKWVVFAKPGDL
jgi:hypothetical protein